MSALDTIKRVLRGQGLDTPQEPGEHFCPHSWRCENPDRYPGYCTCVEDMAQAIETVWQERLAPLRALIEEHERRERHNDTVPLNRISDLVPEPTSAEYRRALGADDEPRVDSDDQTIIPGRSLRDDDPAAPYPGEATSRASLHHDAHSTRRRHQCPHPG